MRIVMMGTGPFALPTFRALLDSDQHQVAALITRPVPAPLGRRKKAAAVPPNPMRDFAESVGLPIYAPASINQADMIPVLSDLDAKLFVVCDYGQILSRETLAVAPLGGINLHGSLLPKYRGAAPINWALYHGESETGVTVIHMTPKLDAGPSLVQLAVAVDSEIDAVQLESQLAELGVTAVDRALAMLQNWDGQSALGELQNDGESSRAPRLKKSDGQIDWRRRASQIRDHVRAFKPWPGTFTHWQHPKRGSLRLGISQVSVGHDSAVDATPGRLTAVAPDRILVACGGGQIALEQLQPAGKKPLSAAEFLRGYPMQVGDALGVDPSQGDPRP